MLLNNDAHLWLLISNYSHDYSSDVTYLAVSLHSSSECVPVSSIARRIPDESSRGMEAACSGAEDIIRYRSDVSLRIIWRSCIVYVHRTFFSA